VKIPFLSIILSICLFSSTLLDIYPACGYVLEEFDINQAYAYNDDFIQYVKRYRTQMERVYYQSVNKEAWIVSMIKGELLDEGLSDLFIYLSIAESGLQSRAVSSKKAAGMWQFIPATARQYDLHVYGALDERYDPFASTHAAIRYLRILHKQFGKWYLAVLAYNCGEGRLSKAIEKAGTDLLPVLLDEQAEYLPEETRTYLKKILLLAMVGESELIFIESSWKWYPDEHIDSVQSKNEIYPKEFLLSYTIQLGDTLKSIAKKYHTDRNGIELLNHLDGKMLEVGEVLVIPVNEKVFWHFSESAN